MILYYGRKFQKKCSPSRPPQPTATTSNIVRYSELLSEDEDEDDENNENEKPTEDFPPTKENPYHYDDENIYEEYS